MNLVITVLYLDSRATRTAQKLITYPSEVFSVLIAVGKVDM